MDRFPREEAEGSEARLRPQDRRFLWFCLLLSAVALAVGFWLYPKVNPEASIRFEIDRRGSEEVAARFLHELGADPSGRRHAARFTYEDDAKVFLERALGPERANELMGGGVRMWRWGHRWFRPLEKEEMSVEVSVRGSVAAFDHQIPEERPGASLSADSARVIAERLLAGPLGLDLSALAFEGVTTQSRPARVDHTFTWKRSDLSLGEGDLRYDVRIQGDAPGGFREYVHIPEEWTRGYQRLRSLNNSAALAASALSILLFIGILVVLFARLRGRDLRWRTALGFGGLGAVLALLAAANGLPSSFYGYETTASLGGFVSRQILNALLGALLLGMFIFLATVSGESLYRERYPGKLNLAGIFSRRGLRTRRFLLQAVLGLAMTCFFFCYQEVFYWIALRLGAWAPLEVPYSELLNTAIPWAFILLIGFMPAVTEEFGFRLFPVPFLQKHLRSTWLALLLPAFVWGFAHSSYPNQPFFIRGLEVGLAGVLVGWIMVRFGILAPLVWHYTVDALYSSTLLFRSGNAYYIVSAALAGGVILLPLVWAAIAYLRSGRFEEPAGLTNTDVSAARAAETPAPSHAPVPTAAPAGMLGAPPFAAGAVERAGALRGWTARRRLAALGFAAAGALLWFLPGERLEIRREMRIGRGDALAVARETLAAFGESPDSFRAAVVPGARPDPLVARYLLAHGGCSALRARYDRWSPPLRWSARFFQPLVTREVSVEVDAADGRAVAGVRRLAEDDSLPDLSPEAAEAAARAFFAGRGIDLSGFVLKDLSEEKRPRRVDRVFLFEAGEGDPRNVAEAKHRIRAVVTGDRVSAWSDSLKLPEEWVRRREKETLWTTLGSLLPILAFGGLFGLLLWQLLRAHRARRVPWRACFLGALLLSALAIAGGVNDWPRVEKGYVTAIPWDVFRFTAGIGIVLGIVVNFLLFALSLAVAVSSWPGEALRLRDGAARRRLLPDALLAAAAAVLLVAGLRRLSGFALAHWPELAPIPSLGLPRGSSGLSTWLALVWSTTRLAVLLAGLGAGVLALARAHARSWRSWGVAGLFALAMAVPGARSAGEVGVHLLLAAVQLSALILAARFVLPGNALAWPLGIYAVVAVSTLQPYVAAAGASFRAAGWAALAALLLPVAALAWGRAARTGAMR